VAVDRVAALYDIHGNLPALRAVLADVERADADLIVIGGDVANGPLPGETVQCLTALGSRCRFVRGNGDREIVAAWQAPGLEGGEPPEAIAAFAADRLDPVQLDWLAGFEPTVELEIPGLGRVLFCHGTPDSDADVITTATPNARLCELVADCGSDLVVCGHTHRQFDRRAGGVRVVNAGAVGLPYEGRRGAFWALLGPGVELRRTEYDHEAAMAELRGGGFKQLDEMLLESLVEPMDPDEVACLMEGTISG
jgi:predicted phosphodiesterase